MPRRAVRPHTVEVVEQHSYAQPLFKEPIDQRRYGGLHVAILKGRVIDSDRVLKALWQRMARKGIEEEVVFFHVPPVGEIRA